MGYQAPTDYIDVAERIREFRDKHPDGSLQRIDWGIQEVAGKAFVYYTAAAYRTPDDERPGIGTAWEPFPGPTPYTKNSELMNAETSAWGRAIIAAGAADAKRVASANEVANRQAEQIPAASSNTDADDYVFKFGKHKGERLQDVPSDYLHYLLKQPAKKGFEQAHQVQHAIFRAELDKRIEDGGSS